MTGLIRIPKGTDLGTVIEDMLQLTGTRPAELARLTGFAEGQISKWRRGMVVPSAPVLMEIFDALGFDLGAAPRIRETPETALSASVVAETPSPGVLGCTGGPEIESGASGAVRASWVAGYDRAVAVLRGVTARSDSPAARWAADYLAADPDRWRQNERCWHSTECAGSGPDCAPDGTRKETR